MKPPRFQWMLLAAIAGGMLAACQSSPPTPVTNWDFSDMHLAPPHEVITANATQPDITPQAHDVFRVEILWQPPPLVDEEQPNAMDTGGGDETGGP